MEADTPQDVVLGEFNYLIECLGISRNTGMSISRRMHLRQWQNC